MKAKSIGEDFSLGAIVTKIDRVTVQPLTDAGWQIYFGIFESKESGLWSGAKLQKTVGSGITITDAAAGAIRIDIEDTDTDDWEKGTYHIFMKSIHPVSGAETDLVKAAPIKFIYSPMRSIDAA